MARIKLTLLACTFLAASPLLAAGGMAMAQRLPTYDPAQLPEVKGKVAQYLLTPRGDLDGLILADGTEVHIPPPFSAQVVAVAKPGDAVTIHGLKARALPMVAAASLTNDATLATITITPPREHMGWGSAMEATGKIKAPLHEARGGVNGVLLEDGTIVRLPPPEAAKLASLLTPGTTVLVRGNGSASALGRVIAAHDIGPDAEHLTHIAPPGHGMMGEWMHERMHEGKGKMHDGAGAPPPPRP